MHLSDLVKPLEQLSDDELLTRLQAVRHNRENVRPVARRKAEKVEAKAARSRVSSITKTLSNLSDEERSALIAQLEGTSE